MVQSSVDKKMSLRDVVLPGILFLFFLQLLSDFVEAVYVFGLMGSGIPPEIVFVLLFLSPVVLFLFAKRIPSWFLLVTGEVMILARILAVMVDTRGKMMLAGIGVAAFMVFFPAQLDVLKKRGKSQVAALGIGLSLAVAASALLKTLNGSVDLSTYGWYQLIGIGLGALAGGLLWQNAKTREPEQSEHKEGALFRIIVYSLGIASVFLLLYFGFASPNVIARWAGLDQRVVAGLFWVGLLGSVWVWVSGRWNARSRKVLLGWNLLFGISMLFTILPRQIQFPASPEGYPIAEPALSWIALVPVVVALLTFPVILIDFDFLVQAFVGESPSTKKSAAGFSISAFYILLMVFAHVFTTVYDYIPVIGPFFRDKFWLVYLLPSVVVVVSAWLASGTASQRLITMEQSRRLSLGLAAMAVVSVAAVAFFAPRPVEMPVNRSSFRVFTYNIQQGYSEDGQWNFDGQLALIQSFDPDILGLQESDTNRIAGGNKDVVGYFANKLNMHVYYGPTPITGTFGIALLSKYPIFNPRVYYLFSVGEQVAVIEAQIEIGGKVYTIYVNHLGNGGPIVQQEQLLALIAGKENVIAIGDFNFRPSTEQYALTVQVLEDAFELNPIMPADETFEPEGRIDHIFVSPGIAVRGASYVLSPASDHPAMYADIEP